MSMVRPGVMVLLLVVVVAGRDAAGQAAPLAPLQIVDDAIPQPLAATPGDAGRGRGLTPGRSKGCCATSHHLPVKADFQRNLGPPLSGAAERYSIGELRLRVVDAKSFNPDSNMPSYHRIHDLGAVRRQSVGRPILTAQGVEDMLAYLQTWR